MPIDILILAALTGVAALDPAETNMVAAGRAAVPFQYAWRFHYGDDPSSPPGSGPGTAVFEQDLANYSVCEGMEHAPNRFSLKDCRIACSYDPNCLVWQAFPIEHGRLCYQGYVGMNITCTAPDPEAPSFMGGGRRAAPPSPAFRTDYLFATADATSDIDRHWDLVDAPHDFIAEYGNFTEDSSDQHHGYLPRNVSWYRKHFHLPAAWQLDGGATFVHFEGVFHHATIFLNGKFLMSHECGYTGFDVRLDNATGIRFGEGKENVLSLRADASFGSGHWYEGGGIYRPVHLVHLAPTHITLDGLFVPPEGDGSLIRASAELETTGPDIAASVRFSLFEVGGFTTPPIAVAMSENTNVPAESRRTVTVSALIKPSAGTVKQWTTKHPQTYSVLAEVLVDNEVVDSVHITVGFRTTTFSGAAGTPPFTLNNQPLQLRGFSHHNSIGGLGVAIPERVQLFRVQASRAMGSNIWRMSHNPYDAALYSLLDATGQMCWDENRDYGAKYGSGVYAVAMRDMVKRDRNHVSVIMWSFCNEAECEQFDSDYSGEAFRAAAKGVDPTRPVAANGALGQIPLAQLDIWGGSHWSNASFAEAHEQNATKPEVLSECCSCTSQRTDRDMDAACIGQQNSPGKIPTVMGSLGVWTLMDYFGEPAGQPLHAWPHVSCDFGQFDIAGHPKPHAYWYAANWLQGNDETEPGRPALPFKTVARILELPGALVSPDEVMANTVEAVTTAAKAELFLDGVSQGVQPTQRNARNEIQPTEWTVNPALGANDKFVGLSACWIGRAEEGVGKCGPPHKGIWEGGQRRLTGGNCTGLSSFPINATGMQCHGLKQVHAKSVFDCAIACCGDEHCDTWQWDFGSEPAPGPGPPIPVTWHNATLVARSSENEVLATHVLFAPSNEPSGYKLQLTVDVPSVTTGTGSALLMDGRDTALVRCAIIDSKADNALVASASNRITWRVVSGPGRFAGQSSGNRSSHTWMKSHSVNAYLGLARGLFRVTEDCTSGFRADCITIDADFGKGPTTVKTTGCNTSPIVVEASAPGFAPVTISIPVSVDVEKDGVLAVARATASFSNGFSYLDDFVG